MKETPVDPEDQAALSTADPGSAGSGAPPQAAARLRAIQDLVCSGDYHVPAAAIADRMIEQLMMEKRRRGH